MNRSADLGALRDRLWARRAPILAVTMALTLVAGAIAFILPPWYRAEAELLPPGEEDVGVGLGSLLRGISLPGIRTAAQVTPADVFMIILQSRRISEEMVQRFDLMRHYKSKLMVDAVKELRSKASFKLTPAGSIQISVVDRDRQRAAEMANAYVELLDRFNRESRMTKGRRTRIFIERRLVETKRDLAAAEQQLATYQAKHKAVSLSPGMSSAVEEAARLYARRVALQVRLGVVRTYSQGSEEELQISQELTQLDQQIRSLPETGLELARLVRDVTAQEQVFALLTAQYEDARITEARDVATVEVLDIAKPPERRAGPRRLLIIAGGMILGLVLGVGNVIIRDEEHPLPVMRAIAGE